MSTQDWDKLLNPFRYNADGTKTEAAQQQDATAMRLNSAGSGGGGGGGGGATSVKPEQLRKRANIVGEIQGDMGRVDDEMMQKTMQASSTFSEWQTGPALKELVGLWREQATALNNALYSISEKLRQNAKNYASTDEDQAQSFGNKNGG